MRKWKCILMAFCLCFVATIESFATDNAKEDSRQESVIHPRYANIKSAVVVLGKNGKKLMPTVNVTSHKVMNISVTMYLEKNSGGGWTSINSWSASKTGGSCSLSKTQTVTSGIYRVKAVINCGGEKITKYSSTVTC